MMASLVASRPRPHGVHLVGSIPLSSTEEVFRYVSTTVGSHVLRLPDGETGERDYFVVWQTFLVPEHVRVNLRSPDRASQLEGTVPQSEVDKTVAELGELETGYDTAAIESYAIFKRLKDQGIIPKHIRFQVSLPTPLNMLISCKPPYQAAIEPVYEAALLRALAHIQAEIPADQLAIQLDMALDMGMIEGLPWLRPWFDGPVLDGVVARAVRMAEQVHPDVELGFHLCYGDMEHKHFLEPKSTQVLVEALNALMKGVKRPVQWLHLPVPKDRDDEEYFLALKGLELGPNTELYLGLVHANDKEGTVKRIKAAEKMGLKRGFGVATECGMGRTPRQELDSIFEILKATSYPVV